ncbi:hypothetical protein D3C80_682890 [compost metagenome]
MRRPADKGGPSRQDGVDGGGAFVRTARQRHPVADRWVADLLGLMDQAARGLGPHLSVRRGDQIAVSLLKNDTSGDVACARMRGEARRQQIRPSILLDQVRAIPIADDLSAAGSHVPL